jgi:hypothetical protein
MDFRRRVEVGCEMNLVGGGKWTGKWWETRRVVNLAGPILTRRKIKMIKIQGQMTQLNLRLVSEILEYKRMTQIQGML